MTNSSSHGDVWRILIIDGTEEAVSDLRDRLEALGHRVEHAVDGKSGLAMAASFRPNLVFIDGDLANATSFEIVCKLRKGIVADDVAVYALTGSTNRSYRKESQEAGFTGQVAREPTDDALRTILSRRS